MRLFGTNQELLTYLFIVLHRACLYTGISVMIAGIYTGISVMIARDDVNSEYNECTAATMRQFFSRARKLQKESSNFICFIRTLRIDFDSGIKNTFNSYAFSVLN